MRNIKIEIVGDATRFTEALGTVDRGLSTLGTAAVASFAAVGAAAAGIGAGLFTLGSNFNDASNTIRIGTGATGEALAELEQSFQNVAREVPASFGDVSTALADINTRLGLTGEPLEQLSEQFLDLSRITGVDVATNVDNITRVFGDWGVEVENQTEAMDRLFRASQSSGIGIDELSTSLVTAGAPLRNIGFSMDEATALLAVFNQTGVNTETVLAGVRQGVGRLARAGEEVPETFSRIVDEITALGPGTEATGLAIELFGQRSGPDLADAIAGGRFEIDAMLESIQGGSDTINAAAADTETFGDRWQQIKNQVFIGLEPAATALFDAISAGADRLGPVIEAVSFNLGNFFTTLTTGFENFAGNGVEGFALSIRETALPIFERLSTFVTDSLVPAVRQFGEFVVAEVLPRVVQFAGFVRDDVVPVVLQLGEFIRDEVVPRFGELAEQIAGNVQPTIEALSEYWTEALQPNLSVVAGFITGTVVPAFLSVADVIIERVVPFVLGDLLPAFIRIQTTVSSSIIPAFQSVVGFIDRNILPAFDSTVSAIGNVVDAALGLRDDVTGAFSAIVSSVSGLRSRITSAAGGMFDGIGSAFNSVINSIINRWNALEFTIPSVEIFGQTVGGGTISTPNISNVGGGGSSGGNGSIRAFMSGTNFAPGGLSLVGERGPELLELPRGASVTPTHQLPAAGGDVIVQVTTPNATAAEIGAAVAWEMRLAGGFA